MARKGEVFFDKPQIDSTVKLVEFHLFALNMGGTVLANHRRV